MDELVFDVTQEADGGYVAECLGEDIFTQGDTWDELRRNVSPQMVMDSLLLSLLSEKK